MAIDNENKRRNVANIATGFLFLGLLPTAGIDDDDRENLSEVYIGFEYSEAVANTSRKSRLRIGVGASIGF